MEAELWGLALTFPVSDVSVDPLLSGPVSSYRGGHWGGGNFEELALESLKGGGERVNEKALCLSRNAVLQNNDYVTVYEHFKHTLHPFGRIPCSC